MQGIGLFIGRFSPFHFGHKRCVEEILKKHRTCVVAIRNTTISEKNPFSFRQRKRMIKKIFGKNVKVIKIPDFTIAYIGRDVGYGLIKLDEATEKISATDIREKLYSKK